MNKRQAWRGMLFAGIGAVTAMTAASADDIRSWTDADGNMHFGDKYAAPEQSRPVELREGTYLNMEVPVVPAPSASTADAAASDKPAAATARTRPCTPLIQEVIDPVSGMHNQRDTGRCQEDEPVPAAADVYPVYVPSCATHSAKKASGCARQHAHPKTNPKPSAPPSASKPVSPATPHPFNQSPVDFSR